jgi:hypothetical protein
MKNKAMLADEDEDYEDYEDDDEEDDDDFQCCDNCDLPDACSDFCQCAIKAGIRKPVEW